MRACITKILLSVLWSISSLQFLTPHYWDYVQKPTFMERKRWWTLCHWRCRENYSDEVPQRTVKRILRGRDTCSHSNIEDYCPEERWLCWEVEIGFRKDHLHFGFMVQVPRSVIILLLKKKHYFFLFSLVHFVTVT